MKRMSSRVQWTKKKSVILYLRLDLDVDFSFRDFTHLDMDLTESLNVNVDKQWSEYLICTYFLPFMITWNVITVYNSGIVLLLSNVFHWKEQKNPAKIHAINWFVRAKFNRIINASSNTNGSTHADSEKIQLSLLKNTRCAVAVMTWSFLD